MKLVPNAYYLYVTDIKRSTSFYESLFEIEPIFTSPRYVAYEIGSGVTFALWSGKSDSVEQNPPRTSELGMNMTIAASELDALYERWIDKGATTVEPPHDDVFGRTFVVADPDGNLIRVAPVD